MRHFRPFSLEEIIIGGVGEQGGHAIFFDAHLFQGERRASDVLREGFSGFAGESRYPNVVIDGKSGVSPINQAGCKGGTFKFVA
jgi:hypothetical protein